MTAPHLEKRNRSNDKQSLTVVVVISVIAHLGLLMAFSSSVQKAVSVPPEIEPIQASIIYPDLTEYQEFDVQTQETPMVETSSPPIEQEPIAQEPQMMESSDVSDEVALPEEALVEPVTLEPSPTTESTSQRSLNQQAGSILRGQRFLEQMQQRSVEQMAEQQSQTYRRQLTSPDLNIPEYVEREAASPVKPKIVACDNTAVNVLRTLSQFAGGNLKCRDQTPIDEFIQRRLNKDP